MTSLFPPFNRRSSFRKQPYFYEAGRGVNYKSTGGPFPTLDLNFLSGTLDPRITFSRASNATLTDSTGKITYAPNNLLTYSQEFDNAIWQKSNTTVTANSIAAPDGTTTADTVSAAGTSYNAVFRPFSSVLSAGPATFSFYAKQGTKSVVRFDANSALTGTVDARANFDLANGVLGTVDTATLTASITNAGSGWYRCSVTWTRAGAAFANGIIAISDSTSSAFGSNSTAGNFYIWGAQLEAVTYQTTPSTYNATTTAVYYGPRFDYDPVTLAAKGLLIEEARTNVITNSENAASFYTYQSQATIGSASSTSPSGLPTVDKIVEGSGSVSPLIARLGVSFSAATYTYSLYAKATGRTWLTIGFYDGAAAYTTYFNVSTGVVGTNPAGTTATISAAGNGWFRCVITRTLPSTVSGQYRLGLANADNGGAYTGDGSSGVLIWGSQSEIGAFATSYIPTVASSVARSADIATMTGTNFSSWFNQGPVNLVLQSQTFDNASWLKQAGAIVTANTTIAPDGTLTADTLTNVNGVASVGILQNIVVSATTYTMQFSVQAGTSNTAFFGFFIGAGFATGTPTILSGPGSVSGTSFCTLSGLSSTQWTRVAFTFTSSAGTGNFYIYPETAGVGTGKNVIIWGAQLEVGSTATTYIPTTTAPVANPPAVGTLLVQSLLAAKSPASYGIYAIDDGTTNNALPSFYTANIAANSRVAASNVFTSGSALLPASPVVVKQAFAFATADYASVFSGGTPTTQASGAVPAVNRLQIGFYNTSYMNAHIQYIKYYPTRLPNTQLVSLTQPSLTPSMQLVFDTSSTSFTDANWSP